MNPATPSFSDSVGATLASLFGPLPTILGVLAVVLGLATLVGPRLRQLARPRARPSKQGTTDRRFQTRAVLEAAERRLLRDIERLMPQLFHPSARLLAQVAMADFLQVPMREDVLSISACRVDMLIVDSGFQPLCAIDFQGAASQAKTPQGRAKARTRDWNKRRALRMAGVPLIEIPAEYDAALLLARLGDATGRRPEGAREASRRRPSLQAGA